MSAKEIILRPVSAGQANALVKRVHYSGKVVNNSQVHIGVYYRGKLEGAMQFGPSLDKRKIKTLVEGTGWNEFIELNRMAFSDNLPRNSESRALAVAMRLLRKHAPHLKWVVTFADGAQCGDGTIYRAAGFVLTSIKKNNQIWEAPDHARVTRMVATDTRRPMRGKLLERYGRGTRESRTSLTDGRSKGQQTAAVRLSRGNATKAGNILETGGASMRSFIEAGFKPIAGYQLRYVYFLDPACREHLTVPVLPYSEIDRLNARMYKGRAASICSDAPGDQPGEGGANPTAAL